MRKKFRPPIFFSLILLTVSLGTAGKLPPPEIPRQGAEILILPGPAVEMATSSPGDPSVSSTSGVRGQTVGGGIAALVDLAKIPVDKPRDGFGPVMSHSQGFYSEVVAGDAGVSLPVSEKTDEPVAPSMENGVSQRSGEFVTGWQGQGWTGWIPPDTQIAVGPEYVVEAVNSGFTVFTKNGAVTRAFTSFENMVNLPSPWNGFLYDPRILYDGEDGKYVMLILGRDDTNLASYYWILSSVNTNPNGQWNSVRFGASRGTPGNEEWLDFASVSVDHWGVYISGNYFLFNGGFTSAAFWCRNKDLLNGSGGAGYYWADLRWPDSSHAFAVTPALPHSQNADEKTFLVASHSGAGSEICLWTLTGERYSGQPGMGGTNVLSNVATTIVSYIAVGDVDQPGSDTDIEGGDSRIGNAVYSQGTVYSTLAFDPDGDGSNAEVYTVALDVSDGSKLWDYTLFHPDYYYFFPTLTVEGSLVGPNWMLGAAVTSPTNTIYAGGVNYVRDVVPDPDVGHFVYHHMGNGSYVQLDTNNRNRWGDYSSTVWDWTCNNGWTAQEYATDSNTWSTWIGAQVLGSEAPCKYIHVVDPNGGETLISGNTYTVSWSEMNIPADEDLYVYFDDGSTNTAQSGTLGSTTTTWNWVVPNTQTSTGKINVGSWNGSTWTASDFSDNTLSIDACTLDGWEPNDTTAQATMIFSGNSLNNSICVSTDIDYFSFIVTEASSVIVETSGPSGDTRMWLLDSDGSTVLAFDDDGGTGFFSRIEEACDADVLMPGTYYIRVDEYANNNHIDDYSVDLDLYPCRTLIFGNNFESGTVSAWSSSSQ